MSHREEWIRSTDQRHFSVCMPARMLRCVSVLFRTAFSALLINYAAASTGAQTDLGSTHYTPAPLAADDEPDDEEESDDGSAQLRERQAPISNEDLIPISIDEEFKLLGDWGDSANDDGD